MYSKHAYLVSATFIEIYCLTQHDSRISVLCVTEGQKGCLKKNMIGDTDLQRDSFVC
jgi:hypothetical protein